MRLLDGAVETLRGASTGCWRPRAKAPRRNLPLHPRHACPSLRRRSPSRHSPLSPLQSATSDKETQTTGTGTDNDVVLVEEGQQKLLFGRDGRWHVDKSTDSGLSRQARRLTDLAAGLFIPTGFPASVSSDYLAYQLWTLPTHVTGWVSSSLATSSLLRAVGIGAGAIPATAMTAAIKWITKDGVGGLGRLAVGGRLSLFIDEDPRLWRMAAEAISTVGLSLEIGTVFFPGQFLLMAGTGNFAKALAKGVAKPSFRVIQQHFARNNNIGEVSAKEESWEVAGQMAGLLTSVLILSLLQDSTDWKPILATWSGFHSVHVICRYLALRSLQFDSLNLARAQLLISAYISGEPTPDTTTVARGESFLTDWLTATPPIRFGCSLLEFAAELSEQGCFQRWQEIFAEETYLLYVDRGRGFVVLKAQSTSLDRLKSLWQFLWLRHSGDATPTVDQIQSSLRITNARYPDFLNQASASGWDLENLLLRAGPVRVTAQES